MNFYKKGALHYPRQLGWVVFIVFLSITQLIALKIFHIEKKGELHHVEEETLFLKNQLESSLNHSITATRVLAFLVEKDLLSDNFDSICQKLLRQNKFIDALQLVKGTTIVNTYPLSGNEAAIGYDISLKTLHAQEAQIARKRGELYFEGPFQLVQGGMGIVGRLPIYQNGAFWGFAAVVIRQETLLKAIGLSPEGKDELYLYQLIKNYTDSEVSTPLFQHEEPFNEGIFHKANVPLGNWDIYVKARHPRHLARALPFSLLGGLLAAVLGAFSWYLARQPVRLGRLVEEKTRDLENLNQTLEKKAKELEFSNNELEQFAYVASHDLQEPLRMVSGFLAQLDKKYAPLLDEKARKYIRFANDGASRMRRTILDILEFSRIGTTEDAMESVDVTKILEEVCQLERRIIETKSAKVTSENLPVIQFYRVPMIRILRNLIDNALKYTPTGTTPDIKVTCAINGDMWQFSVKDNGIGIDPKDFERIFIAFNRLHQKEEYLGSGIGLAVTKKLLEGLGGHIWVESALQKGSIFHFTIPRQS